MFAGLFIIVAGAQRALLTPDLIAAVGRLHLDQIPGSAAVTAVLSNLVSNVPAVLMLKPFVAALPTTTRAWLVDRDGFDARRQFHRARLDRQSHRRARGARRRGRRSASGTISRSARR